MDSKTDQAQLKHIHSHSVNHNGYSAANSETALEHVITHVLYHNLVQLCMRCTTFYFYLVAITI